MNARTPLLHVLSTVLQAAKKPMTCNDMVALPAVKKLIDDPRRVSDYMGNLWRKGLIGRIPVAVTETSKARWAYHWKQPKPAKWIAAPVVPKKKDRQAASRPEVVITENPGSITIDLPTMRITIQHTADAQT